MGGRSASSNRLGLVSAAGTGTEDEMRRVERELNYELPMGADSRRVIGISNIDSEGYGDVEYETTYYLEETEYDSDGIPYTTRHREVEYGTQRRKVR